MTDQKFKIRAALLFEFKLGKTAKASYTDVCKAYGDNAICYSQCSRWFKRFQEGNEDLEDEKREGRPKEMNNEELLKVIEEDPTLTGRQIAVLFKKDHTTITRHLNLLGKKNLCGKWLPHALTSANKIARVSLSSILLRMSKNSCFWESILTADETWISFDNPHAKRQWLGANQTAVGVPKAPNHGKKMMLCLWWNSRGLVHFEVLKKGETVNANLYSDQLVRVNQALKKKGSIQPP